MGFGVTELLILLAIVALLFGTKKLRSLGSDVGSAVKGFKSAMQDDDSNDKLANKAQTQQSSDRVIDGQTESNPEDSKQG